MPRYLIYFSYIGTAYRGAQKSYRGKWTDYVELSSVQGIIEAALRKLKPDKAPMLYVSSRTDSGVHALMNTAHVDMTHPTPGAMFTPHLISGVINQHLAECEQEARVFKVRIVPQSFHVRACAKKRTYLYRLAVHTPSAYRDYQPPRDRTNQSLLPSIELNRCHCIRSPFNMDSVQKAAALFSGYHDFTNFTASESRREAHTEVERELDYVRVEPGRGLMDPSWNPLYDNLTFYNVTVRARSFIFRQVRRIVGALEAVGRGIITVDDVADMIRNPEQKKWETRVTIAPAWGLYLQNIEYDECDLRLPDLYLYRYGIDVDQYCSDMEPNVDRPIITALPNS